MSRNFTTACAKCNEELDKDLLCRACGNHYNYDTVYNNNGKFYLYTREELKDGKL